LFVVVAIIATPVWAIVSVGPDTGPNGCHFHTIQAAITAIENDEKINNPVVPDADYYIAIAGAGFVQSSSFNGYFDGIYHEKLLASDSGISWPSNPPGFQGLRFALIGGYDGYCNTDPNGSFTEIHAGNNSGNSVLEVSGNAAVFVYNLVMAGATGGVFAGGGINFHGQGELHLTNVDVAGNRADYGGGIYANGSGPLSVFLHQDTLVEDNTAKQAGGGIRISGQTRLYALAPNVQIIDNTADPHSGDGDGGGLQVLGPARADLGSISILRNTARQGGGIAVNVSTTDKAVVRMFRTDPYIPTLIANNTAWDNGGGIYNSANVTAPTLTEGLVCGDGYSITGNAASQGAALFANDDTNVAGNSNAGGYFFLRRDSSNFCGPEPATQLGAVVCPVGAPCNHINDNRAVDSTQNPTNGAVLFMQGISRISVDSLESRGNVAGTLFNGNDGVSAMANCLIFGNSISGDLIRSSNSILLTNCTVADNGFNGSVLRGTGSISVRKSILWQPGKTLRSPAAGPGEDKDVIANDVSTLSQSPDVISVPDPGFVSLITGDYHLLQTSPAVDYSASDSISATDLDGNPRNKDLVKTNLFGPVDLGVYELQSYVAPPSCAQSDTDTIFCDAFD
jgi:hypothetical protein